MSDDEKALKLLRRLQMESGNKIWLKPSSEFQEWYVKISNEVMLKTFCSGNLLDAVFDACNFERKGHLIADLIWDEAKEEVAYHGDVGPGSVDNVLDQLRALGYKISKERKEGDDRLPSVGLGRRLRRR